MADLKTAMLARDEKSLRGLRAIKAAILLAKTSEGAGGELKEDDEIKLWREVNDGMFWVRKLCKPEKGQFTIIGIQVTGNVSIYLVY